MGLLGWDLLLAFALLHQPVSSLLCMQRVQ